MTGGRPALETSATYVVRNPPVLAGETPAMTAGTGCSTTTEASQWIDFAGGVQFHRAMPLGFEWDENKSRANLAKHGVSFEEAATVFGDPLSSTIPDPAHSQAEDRFVILGQSHRGKLLVVVHTGRGDNIRVISARRASKREHKQYEEASG